MRTTDHFYSPAFALPPEHRSFDEQVKELAGTTCKTALALLEDLQIVGSLDEVGKLQERIKFTLQNLDSCFHYPKVIPNLDQRRANAKTFIRRHICPPESIDDNTLREKILGLENDYKAKLAQIIHH
jgi:hypothetical protein